MNHGKIRKILRAISWILALLGAVFILTLIGMIFLSPAHTQDDKPLTLAGGATGTSSSPLSSPLSSPSTPPAAGSPEFLATLSHLTSASIGSMGQSDGQNDAPALVTDSAFLPALLGAIGDASSSIDLTDYPWANGSFNDQLFAALTAAARRGVSVRVLLDSFGAHTVPASSIQTLEQAGGKVAEYHSFSLLDPMQYDERDHMRAFVIDGKTAFIGSVGIVDYWIENAAGFSQWNDFMTEVSGAMAQAVQGDFAQMWGETTGEVLSGPAFYPVTAPASTLPLSSLQSAPQSSVGADSSADTGAFISIASLPSPNADPVRDTFMMTALSAQKTLYIINPFIIPDQGFLDVLEAKARAGVDVRILSPGPITIAPILRSAWHADYEQLLEAGVKLYEYQPSMIHAKMMVADGAWSVVGSANIDNRSDSLNAENIIGIADPAFAAQLDTVFMNDLTQSKQITLASWHQQYGFFSRLMSHLWLAFWKQL